LNRLQERSVSTTGLDGLPQTIADRTRWIYDRVALVYPLSTLFFHAKAHEEAISLSGISNGMQILEVATGSGEMFRRLVKANPSGTTLGVDLSPNMASRTHKQVRKEFPEARTLCKAVDARFLPFRDDSFDAVVCCYLLELLSADDILLTLREFHRVLRRRGNLTLVLIGQNTDVFNRLYKVCNFVAPAFWGRQVETRVPEMIESLDFSILRERSVKQSGYPSRVLVAKK
jgi:ubiquinone/menaquinone biosynthesis C-methylase UbiE